MLNLDNYIDPNCFVLRLVTLVLIIPNSSIGIWRTDLIEEKVSASELLFLSSKGCLVKLGIVHFSKRQKTLKNIFVTIIFNKHRKTSNNYARDLESLLELFQLAWLLVEIAFSSLKKQKRKQFGNIGKQNWAPSPGKRVQMVSYFWWEKIHIFLSLKCSSLIEIGHNRGVKFFFSQSADWGLNRAKEIFS